MLQLPLLFQLKCASNCTACLVYMYGNKKICCLILSVWLQKLLFTFQSVQADGNKMQQSECVHTDIFLGLCPALCCNCIYPLGSNKTKYNL